MKTPSLRLFAGVAFAMAIHVATVVCARADTNFGFTFSYSGSGSAQMLTNTSWNDLRFTATKDITVDRFAMVVGSAVGDPRLLVSLQADNAGNPSGTSLANTVLAPGALAGNLYGSFGSSVSLTKGTVYHIVTSVTNGSSANSLTLRALNGAVLSRSPQTGAPDPSLNRLWSVNSGSTWTPYNQTNASVIVVALGNSSGEAVGQPESAAYTGFAVATNSVRGERFIWNGNTGDSVTSVTLRVSKGTGDAADNLNVLFLNSSLQILSSNLFLSAGFTNTAVNNYTINLNTPLVLTNGLTYNLVAQSARSSASSYQMLAMGVPLTNMFDASFGGTNDYAITGTGLTSLYNAGDSSTAYDAWFDLGIVSIPEPTTLGIALLGLGALALRRHARA